MAAPFVGAGIGFIVGGPVGAAAGWGVGELIGNGADALNTGWYAGEGAYYASQGEGEKAQEAFTNAALSGVGLIPFGNIVGKGGKWLGKTKVGQWGGDALEALGKTQVGQWGGDALEWAGKQGGKAVDWLGQQGGKALDWAGKQREQVINWGGDALEWAGRQGDELLRPVDDLLTGRNLEMAGVPRGAKPKVNAPTNPAKVKSGEVGTPTSTPHSKKSDVDVSTPVSTKVGEIDHEVKPRLVGDQIEIWVCSDACGNVSAKIDDMLQQLPNDPTYQQLRDDLLALQKEVEALRPRLETGKNTDGNFWKHSEISQAAGQIAKRFEELGKKHPVVGDALNQPSQIRNLPTREPIRFNPSETITIMQQQGLPDETWLSYIIRDKKTGAVLKTGETTVKNSNRRFTVYEKAARRTKLTDVEIEVTPIQATNRSEAKEIEYGVRSDLESQGQILPWDNEGGRLGRKGPGTPFESLPGGSSLKEEGYKWNEKGHLTTEAGETANVPRKNAPPSRAELEELMKKHKGNQTAIAAELNKPVGTVYSLMSRNNLSSDDFKP